MQKKNLTLSFSLLIIISYTIIQNFVPFLNTVYSQISDQEYADYFYLNTEKSVNLTRSYQDKIALWISGDYSNTTMVNITETFLPKFIEQLNQFNNTSAPEKFSSVKVNLVKSFEYEIKSYELFRDYLIINNVTKNEISNDYLSESLKFETIAFEEFNKVVDIVPVLNKESYQFVKMGF